LEERVPIPPDEIAPLQELVGVRHHLRDLLAAVARDQLIPLPPLPTDADTLHACDELLARFGQGEGPTHIPDDAFSIPKWVFVEHAIRHGGFLAHGSADPQITCFEPRAAQDNLAGGEQPRVYAASSGVLAGFYAVVDRRRLDELPVIPGLINVYVPPLETGDADRFHFALDWRALPYAPWRRGTVYLLPRAPFTADEAGEQWFSREPVAPRLTLSLAPEEWPLLGAVRGADVLAFLRRLNHSHDGWPWWPDPAVYPDAVAR
jgi:hypothetical protein